MEETDVPSTAVQQMVAGANGVLGALKQIFPTATGAELLEKLEAIEHSPIATELLAAFLNRFKIRP